MPATTGPSYSDEKEGQDSRLEQQLITEYLLNKGYQRADLQNLPETQRKELMRDACQYASFKLADIEARSKFRRRIGGV